MQDACVRTRLGRVLVFLALCAFLLTTQMYDSESSLNYNYYRDYASGAGRDVESDPIGLNGGLNTSSYVSGRPTAATDPGGSVATNLAAGTYTVRITPW